jgi:hypothetical protein
MKSPFRVLAVAACAVLALTISACGSSTGSAGSAGSASGCASAAPGSGRDSKGDMSATPGQAAPSSAQTLKIVFAGCKVSPVAQRIELGLNKSLVLEIHADKVGQLHVHSTPQHSIDFPTGDSTVTLSFSTPGIIDIEDHALGSLIAQVEVS